MSDTKLKLLLQLSILNRGINYSEEIEDYIHQELLKLKEISKISF